MLLAALPLLIAAFCAYQALAAGELDGGRESFRLIDGAVGIASLFGTGWLLRLKPPSVA